MVMWNEMNRSGEKFHLDLRDTGDRVYLNKVHMSNYYLGHDKLKQRSCVAAFARSGRSHRRGDGEEDGGANPGSLRPAGCAGQQCRHPGHGQHWVHGYGSVRQGHEHQCQVGFYSTSHRRTVCKESVCQMVLNKNREPLNLNISAQLQQKQNRFGGKKWFIVIRPFVTQQISSVLIVASDPESVQK